MEYTSHIHRLFRLIVQIQGSPNLLNAYRLAEIFDVHVRTIFRDLEILKDSGIPISPDPDSGGYTIRRDFFLRPVDLTLEEAMALLMLAERIGAAEQVPHLVHAGKAAEKILSVLPRQIGEMINEILPRVTVSLARNANEPVADVYARMRDAIICKRALECEYESPSRRPSAEPGDAGIFRFDPYDLYFGQCAWYAIGFHHVRNEIRTLKLCRFTRCKATDKPYFIPDDFSSARHFGKAWRMMPSGTLHAIKLRFDPVCAETVVDTHWHDSQQHEWLDGGSIEMTFEVDGLEEIIWWIMSYGPHCRVLAPPELIQRVQSLQSAAAGQYSSL